MLREIEELQEELELLVATYGLSHSLVVEKSEELNGALNKYMLLKKEKLSDAEKPK